MAEHVGVSGVTAHFTPVFSAVGRNSTFAHRVNHKNTNACRVTVNLSNPPHWWSPAAPALQPTLEHSPLKHTHTRAQILRVIHNISLTSVLAGTHHFTWSYANTTTHAQLHLDKGQSQGKYHVHNVVQMQLSNPNPSSNTIETCKKQLLLLLSAHVKPFCCFLILFLYSCGHLAKQSLSDIQ